MPDRNEAGVILVVDDDPTFVRLVTGLLEREGHEVVQARDAESALSVIDARRPDLVVLDIEMPGMSGLELLNRLPAGAQVPVIVVSGREAETERVLALDLGADDFVIEPFVDGEVPARIRSVLRRCRRPGRPVPLVFGALSVYLAEREVRVDGHLVETTPLEFDLLVRLVSSPRQVFSRADLLEQVWGSSGAWQSPATVTEHIRRLRLKLEADRDHPRWLRTVRGVGYRFDP